MTIWQSELNAVATDREPAEAWAAYAALWSAGFKAAAALLPPLLPPFSGMPDGAPRHSRGSNGRAGAESPPGSAAAVAASDAGNVAGRDAAERIEQLARRVEELERRLAGLGEPLAEPPAKP
jgi:hypothetical protein